MRLSWRRKVLGFDEAVSSALTKMTEELVSAGHDLDEVTSVAAKALVRVTDGAAPRIAATVRSRTPRLLRARARNARVLSRALRMYWGEALDRYLEICAGVEEVGKHFHDRLAFAEEEEQNAAFYALIGLYARACRTAFEIHHLLAGGFPMAALARSRTLHEIAVIMMVLSEFGDEHADLAERFLLHEVVQTWKDAKIYQEHCVALGNEPFTDEELADMEQQRDELVHRFGPHYRQAYGWASGTGGLSNPTFADLEKLVGVAHLRGHYSWANHEVHADSKGWQLNILERGDRVYQETGSTHFGLAEPASWSLNSLQQCVATLVLSAEDISPAEFAVSRTMQYLIDEATEAFVIAEEKAEMTDERLFRLAPWRRRLWLLGHSGIRADQATQANRT